jgi:hypothetical protein
MAQVQNTVLKARLLGLQRCFVSRERVSGIKKDWLEVRVLACGKLVRDPPLFYLFFVLCMLLQRRILVLL